MVAAAAVVALAAPRVLTVTVAQLWAPFDLTLEVPTVNTILLLRQGVDVYARETFAAPPFNLLMYTPAYHYLVALMPWPHEISPFTIRGSSRRSRCSSRWPRSSGLRSRVGVGSWRRPPPGSSWPYRR